MLRGEFIRGDGLVIPNNITIYGSGLILQGFARHVVVPFTVALCNCVPDPSLALADLGEPTGAHGYARIAVTQDAAGWPTFNTLNGESYVETDYLIWTASGGNFSAEVNRLALMNADNVIAVSGAMPTPLLITPTTVEADRKYKYRMYLR